MKIGDMIEINRGRYKHWALYIGNGYVIHLVVPGMMFFYKYGSSGFWSAFLSSSPSVSCKGMIIIDTLKDVAAGDPCNIYNYLDDEYKPRRTDVIREDVDKMRGFTIKYDLLGQNCEHFVTFLRYGKSESKQVIKPPPGFISIVNGSSQLKVIVNPGLDFIWVCETCTLMF
uniref:LRAT domain-containing protein n=1 Tax=Oncorhynchus tshawytscha TaxID=74940 RepID=A0A8C8GZX7_ONCTS